MNVADFIQSDLEKINNIALGNNETHDKFIASLVDLTTLGLSDNEKEVQELISKGEKYQVAGLCTYASFLPLTSKSSLRAVSVAGFPSGHIPSCAKVNEVKECFEMGASEVDIVINRSLLLNDTLAFSKEIAECVRVSESYQGELKVILEISELNFSQIKQASQISLESGAHFLKTSTGFSSHGAKIEAFCVMGKAIQEGSFASGLKASGGVKTKEDALSFMKAAKFYLKDLSCSNFRIGASSLLGDLSVS